MRALFLFLLQFFHIPFFSASSPHLRSRLLIIREKSKIKIYSLAAAILRPGKNTLRIFLHVQVILYGVDPLDATGDFTSFIDRPLGINETAQLDGVLVSFYTALE
jgi:hypothetical protein